MELTHLRIERFRGIGRFVVDLGALTVLIGENNCGKTSILDAVQLALDERLSDERPPLAELDFHLEPGERRPSAAPMRIRLGFQERGAGEWSPELLDRLGPAAAEGRDGRRLVTLDARVRWRRDGPGRAELAFLDARERPLDVDAVALHRALCILKPVYSLDIDAPRSRLNDGAAPEVATARRASATAHTAHRDDAALADKLVRLHDALLDPNVDLRTIESEIVALGALLRLTADESAAMDDSPDRLCEVLGRRLSTLITDPETPIPLHRQGGAMRAMLIMLLAGATIASRPGRGRDPLAAPLLLVHDPEAHLHPSSLAFIARLLNTVPAQKLVVTHSGELLASIETGEIRRLRRRGGDVQAHALRPNTLRADEARKITYHIQSRRGVALFARCWLLVEGETEFWLVPAMAQALGVNLWMESVACVEFAQCGIEPLIKLARDLGIEWHLLADGDRAGAAYERAASDWLRDESAERRITSLAAGDMEHCLWQNGFADVYRKAAGFTGARVRGRRGENPNAVIATAIRRTSKPHLAGAVIEALEQRMREEDSAEGGSGVGAARPPLDAGWPRRRRGWDSSRREPAHTQGRERDEPRPPEHSAVPLPIRRAIESAVRLAREQR